ncbi:unnamed protein product [Brassica rapa]|uniref:Uncharacterized protein n=1 Tax=Brassica campestris TaxID=3711 RepID=A0A8D9FYV9_BRACM|nr:unnamed protein product [Brassica rapa]
MFLSYLCLFGSINKNQVCVWLSTLHSVLFRLDTEPRTVFTAHSDLLLGASVFVFIAAVYDMLRSISEARKMSLKGGLESCMKRFRSAGVSKRSGKGSCFIEIQASSGLTTVIMVFFAHISAVKVEGVLYLVSESP